MKPMRPALDLNLAQASNSSPNVKLVLTVTAETHGDPNLDATFLPQNLFSKKTYEGAALEPATDAVIQQRSKCGLELGL